MDTNDRHFTPRDIVAQAFHAAPSVDPVRLRADLDEVAVASTDLPQD